MMDTKTLLYTRGGNPFAYVRLEDYARLRGLVGGMCMRVRVTLETTPADDNTHSFHMHTQREAPT